MSVVGSMAEPVREKQSRKPGADLSRADWAERSRKILWWLMVIGIALRVCRYLADRSLWLDESYLANSILTFSFGDFFHKSLLQWQAAPIGFLLLEKTTVSLLGTSEYALRLVPLLAGILSIPLFYRILRNCLEPTAQVLAMTLFITLEPLIYYSSEAKQYGIDVTVALAVILAALQLKQNPRNWGRLIVLAVIGQLAIFLSHPAIFMLAAVGIVLVTVFLHSNHKQPLWRLIIVGFTWIALFTVNYVYFLRPLTHHAGLARYWAADYMPYTFPAAMAWLGRSFYQLYHNYATMGLLIVDTAMIATVIGIGWFWQHQRAALGMLLLPLVLALVAAGIHAYPFGSRLVLFVVPMIIVLIGAGSAMIWEGFNPKLRIIPALILATIFLPTACRAAFLLVKPVDREAIRPAMAYIRDHHKPGDKLYILGISEVPFHYYEDRFGLERDRFHLSDMHWILGQKCDPDPSLYRADLARLHGQGRVWILLSHVRARGDVDEEQIFPALLNPWGRQLDRFQAYHASATLYDMDYNPIVQP